MYIASWIFFLFFISMFKQNVFFFFSYCKGEGRETWGKRPISQVLYSEVETWDNWLTDKKKESTLSFWSPPTKPFWQEEDPPYFETLSEKRRPLILKEHLFLEPHKLLLDGLPRRNQSKWYSWTTRRTSIFPVL